MLRMPGRSVLRSNERGLPVGREAVQDTEYDFRQPRQIGSTTLDHAFTDLVGTRMASLVSSSVIRTTEPASRCGSTRATPI